MRKTDDTRLGRVWSSWKSPALLMGMYTGPTTLDNWPNIDKLNTCRSDDPEMPLSDVFPKGTYT